ncbi:aminotransferase class III-fold pyridoxal phosphate-dependent enzyme [Kordia sp. TARA_039_SRF]|nr:aminotransferase class III-fold pyridoxal phosphate-dependent enzyme [Kordia sp. TARA_039_SRF]
MIESSKHSTGLYTEIQSTYPRITYGKGVYLYDTSGKKYLDASAGSVAVSTIGHGIEELAKIIKKQTQKASILPAHAVTNKVVEKYLKRLVQFAPSGFKQALTMTSGTEAVEKALKIVLQYHQLLGNTNRCKIVSRWFSHHESSIFTLNVGEAEGNHKTYEQWKHNFPRVQPTYKYRYGNKLSEDEYCDYCVDEFKKTIEKNNPETIAAFIAEPVVGTTLGAVTPPKNYFSRIKKICEHFGILFISDELTTGFGRLGTNFGIEEFQITPDIIVAGKGMSGGYFPLAAVLINKKIASIFEENQVTLKTNCTHVNNPVGAAVGSYVLDYIEKNKILENVSQRGVELKKRLEELKVSPIIGEIRGKGLLLGVEFVINKKSKTPFPAEMNISERIFQKTLEKGVIVYPRKGSSDGVQGDHILVCPPLTITAKEVDFLADKLIEAVAEIQKEIITTVTSFQSRRNSKIQLTALVEK